MNRIILALDTTNLEDALSITKKIKDKIFTVKLGLEFFNAHGKQGIKKFNEIGINNLMLDLKLKDIPETVYKAIKVLHDIEFSYLTIHGQGGKKLIENAIKAASEIKSKPKIMMVTILTLIFLKTEFFRLKKKMMWRQQQSDSGIQDAELSQITN